MEKVIVYFISGDIIGEHVVAMEEKMAEVYPNRTTNIIHVDSEEEKYRVLSTYNVEEMDGYMADVLWQAIEDYDEDTDS
jgi:hypothetical protein